MSQTFKQYLQSQGKSQSTVTHYNTYALEFLSWLDKDGTEAENTTAKEVLSFLNHLQKPVYQGGKGQSNKTRNIRLNVIKQFFNWQILGGIRKDNPVAHLKIRGANHRKLYSILSRAELEKIYNHYPIPTKEHPKANRNWFAQYRLSKTRNKVILSLLINQGLTTPEIERLNQNDLKLKEGKIYIAGSRKSNERTLELKSHQIMELMEYTWQTRTALMQYQTNKTTTQLFLPLPTAGKEKARESLQIFKGLTKEIKAENQTFINFKQIRASVITHWLKTHNLREVQYMAGHRYVSSTEQYLVNQVEDLQTEIDKYHPVY